MIKGNLDRLHFGDLLQWLQLGGLSGRLTMHCHRGERRLDFRNGRVIFVSSTVPDERIASWLARKRDLPGVELRRLLALALLRRKMFTELLVTDGAITAGDLKRSLAELAAVMTSRILHTPGAAFEFDPAYPVEEDRGLCLDLEPRRLLIDAARRSDEDRRTGRAVRVRNLPLAGEDFEAFFWQLIAEGIGPENPVDGEEISSLYALLRDIVGTLAQWVASSPGLVPLPAGQLERIAQESDGGRHIGLFGLPHAAWNQMVLDCSVRSAEDRRPRTLSSLEETAADLDLWMEMTRSDLWRRPRAAKLDELTRRVVVSWSRSAAAAAPYLGVDPAIASLAAHLVVVPTDLVLWVLSTLPVSHPGVRQALLKRLPRRVGSRLAHLADFPSAILELFHPQKPTPLGVSLHLGRENLPSSPVWPRTVPDDEERLLEVASPGALAMASDAAREVSKEASGEFVVAS